jgi:hypothetical protein
VAPLPYDPPRDINCHAHDISRAQRSGVGIKHAGTPAGQETACTVFQRHPGKTVSSTTTKGKVVSLQLSTSPPKALVRWLRRRDVLFCYPLPRPPRRQKQAIPPREKQSASAATDCPYPYAQQSAAHKGLGWHSRIIDVLRQMTLRSIQSVQQKLVAGIPLDAAMKKTTRFTDRTMELCPA